MPDAEVLTAIAANIVALGGILAIVMTKLGSTHDKVKQVSDKLRHETEPNHGSSLKDALNRIESAQRGMSKDIGRLADSDVVMAQDKAEAHHQIHVRLDQLATELERMRVNNHG